MFGCLFNNGNKFNIANKMCFRPGGNPSFSVKMFKQQTNKIIRTYDIGFVFTKYFVGDKGGVMKALKEAATVDGVYDETEMKKIIESFFKSEHPLFNVYHNDTLLKFDSTDNSCIDVLNMVFEPGSDGKTSFSVLIRLYDHRTSTSAIKISETDLWSNLFTSSGDILLSIPNSIDLNYPASTVVQLPWESASQPATRFLYENSFGKRLVIVLPAGTIIGSGNSQESLTEPKIVLFFT